MYLSLTFPPQDKLLKQSVWIKAYMDFLSFSYRWPNCLPERSHEFILSEICQCEYFLICLPALGNYFFSLSGLVFEWDTRGCFKKSGFHSDIGSSFQCKQPLLQPNGQSSVREMRPCLESVPPRPSLDEEQNVETHLHLFRM